MTLADPATGVFEDPLSDAEYADLEKLETRISKGLDTFVDVGNALAEIRDRKLYRQYHSSFAVYCETQWDMGKSHAYRLIDAAEIVTGLSGIPDETSPIGDTESPMGDVPLPATESQARALKDVDPADRAEVMKRASADGPATGKKIRDAAAEIDPTLKVRQDQEAARAKARAESAAKDAAKAAERKQAEADAAVIAAAQAEREATDLTAHAIAENRKVRSALQGLLDLDAITTAAYADDVDRRLRQLERVEHWCATHRASLNPEAATTLHVINGGA